MHHKRIQETTSIPPPVASGEKTSFAEEFTMQLAISPLSEQAPPARLLSLDVFRGITMLFMAIEILRIPEVARSFNNNRFAQFAASMLDHRDWVGCAPWDLIQPAFMFMVGVSLPYSRASRRAKGDSFGRRFVHSLYRSLILIALGIFLRSQHSSQTNFTFVDVLTQIGLGYMFLFLLAETSPKVQWTAALLILVGYWLAFALYPVPAPDFNTVSVGVPADWPHQLTGFAAHWNKNTNFGNRFDQWFLNLFPRETPFVYNNGGYLTLNFIPSLVTMIFGLLAGELLRSKRPEMEKSRTLLIFGVLGLISGAVLHAFGICPLVKRIWTSSWTVYSAGWTVLFLAVLYYLIDLKGYRRWTFPFRVVGLNSIAMYLLVNAAADYLTSSLQIHLGPRVFNLMGEHFAPILTGFVALLIMWLILLWMYRRKIFLRI
jgi:heparan-alpha-glucosaminide N-acetyltransferase